MLTVLSLPPTWEFSIQGLATIVKESKPTIAKIIHELMAHGYCVRERATDPFTGRVLKWEYTFFEVKNGNGCEFEPESKNPEVENPQPGKPTSGKVATISNTNISSINKSNNINNNNKYTRFDFFAALKQIGVSDEVARAWMQVRKTKRATNTKIAFDRIKSEIEKAGRPADDCIRYAVEKSWQGFNATWLPATARKYESFEETMARLGIK